MRLEAIRIGRTAGRGEPWSNSVQNLAIEFQDPEASEDDSFTSIEEPSIIEHKAYRDTWR